MCELISLLRIMFVVFLTFSFLESSFVCTAKLLKKTGLVSSILLWVLLLYKLDLRAKSSSVTVRVSSGFPWHCRVTFFQK